MAVRNSIFGSKSEERGFRSIESKWGESYRLFSQTPFSALFTPDPRWRDSSHLFFKTSVDYVLCTSEGRPLLAIDFDGLGRGFDKDDGGLYTQVKETEDKYRKLKFDFKLKYARKNGFPYHIISFDEFNSIGGGMDLTVVDGIIGSVLSKKSLLDGITSFLEEHSDTIDNLPPVERSEYIQDLVIGFEALCDLEHNPIILKKVEVRGDVLEIIGFDSWSMTIQELEPEMPSLDASARVQAMEDVEEQGCAVTISDTPVEEVSEVVRIRSVAYSISLVREIAELLAWYKVLRLLQPRNNNIDNLPLSQQLPLFPLMQ